MVDNNLSVEAVGKSSPAGVRLANGCSVQLLLQFIFSFAIFNMKRYFCNPSEGQGAILRYVLKSFCNISLDIFFNPSEGRGERRQFSEIFFVIFFRYFLDNF